MFSSTFCSILSVENTVSISVNKNIASVYVLDEGNGQWECSCSGEFKEFERHCRWLIVRGSDHFII